MDAMVLVSFVMLAICTVARPTRITCPAGWYAEGVRPTGRSACVQVPKTAPDCRGSKVCVDDGISSPRFAIQIYCADGKIPLSIDGTTVECRRWP